MNLNLLGLLGGLTPYGLGSGIGLKPRLIRQDFPYRPYSSMNRTPTIPTKICPTCGGTGRVPDTEAIAGMVRGSFPVKF